MSGTRRPDSERSPTAQVQAAPSAAAPDSRQGRGQPHQVRQRADDQQRHRETAQVAGHVVGGSACRGPRPGRSGCRGRGALEEDQPGRRARRHRRQGEPDRLGQRRPRPTRRPRPPRPQPMARSAQAGRAIWLSAPETSTRNPAAPTSSCRRRGCARGRPESATGRRRRRGRERARGTSTRQKTARSAGGTSRRRVKGVRAHRDGLGQGGDQGPRRQGDQVELEGQPQGLEGSAIRPPMPGPAPSPSRIEIEPSIATKRRRPSGAASTRAEGRCRPKKAPAAGPGSPGPPAAPPAAARRSGSPGRPPGRDRDQEHALAPDAVRELSEAGIEGTSVIT